MLLAICFAFALQASAAPYIVTNFVELSIYTEPGFTNLRTTEPASLFTYTRTVEPASSVNGISTITASENYAEVTIIDIVVSGPIATKTPSTSTYDITDPDFYSTYMDIQTQYVVPITYLPNSSCTSQSWTWSTNVPVDIPSIVSLSPVSLSTSTSVYSYQFLNPTTTTEVFAILNPTDVAAADLSSASEEGKPYGLSYCYTPTTYCYTPTAGAATCTPTFEFDSSSRSSSSSSFYGGYDEDNDYIRDIILIAVLVPVGWILIWLFIGLLESWLSFKGLMLGMHRKRGVPYAWCCISFLFLCCTGPTYKAKRYVSVSVSVPVPAFWNILFFHSKENGNENADFDLEIVRKNKRGWRSCGRRWGLGRSLRCG